MMKEWPSDLKLNEFGFWFIAITICLLPLLVQILESFLSPEYVRQLFLIVRTI